MIWWIFSRKYYWKVSIKSCDKFLLDILEIEFKNPGHMFMELCSLEENQGNIHNIQKFLLGAGRAGGTLGENRF